MRHREGLPYSGPLTAHSRRSPLGGTMRCSFPEADVGSHVQQIERLDGGYADNAAHLECMLLGPIG